MPDVNWPKVWLRTASNLGIQAVPNGAVLPSVICTCQDAAGSRAGSPTHDIYALVSVMEPRVIVGGPGVVLRVGGMVVVSSEVMVATAPRPGYVPPHRTG